MTARDYHEFGRPIPVRIRAGNGPIKWPTGKALAYGFFRAGLDCHNVWHVCFDDGGQWWEIENPYVRGEPNASWGRTLEGVTEIVYPPLSPGLQSDYVRIP